MASPTKDKPIAALIKAWIDYTEGVFRIEQVYAAFPDYTKDPITKRYISNVLSRLVKDGYIERDGAKYGYFRRVEKAIQRMDFINIDAKPIDIWLPLNLHKMIKLFPGEIIIIAGAKSAGKTTFALNIAWANRNTWTVNYYNSEMGAVALRHKLQLFDNTDLMEWAEKINFYSRSVNFEDVVDTSDKALNIIDYLEQPTDYWLVGASIAAIHRKIVNSNANAVICLQKPKSRDEGIGGRGTLDKAMLYLAINKGSAKIVDAKNWADKQGNPNDQECTFKLVHGSEIVLHSPWDTNNKDRWSM